jgi:hypothetical protein
MLPDMHVVSIDFDTEEFHDWNPRDPSDCEVWTHVNVGNDRGASYFQVHICTPQSIRRIENKRFCFSIDEFRGAHDLVERLDQFIEDRVANKPGDPYHILSKHWAWEYDPNLRF